MNILTDHQPAYLPWLGLFHRIALSDGYCYLDNVQYLVREFNNRNRIKTSSGPLWLSVPVRTKGHREKQVKDIEIENSIDWQRKHWKAIYLNYKKAPYFSRYIDFFEDVYKKEWSYLADLNEYMLKWFLKELGIKVKFYKASELSLKGEKSDLILEIAKKLKADLYILGPFGRDYIKEKDFSKAGIKLYFQNYHHPVYSQLYGEFLPYMSIIDLLFNCGDKSLEILMRGNIKKQELSNLYGAK